MFETGEIVTYKEGDFTRVVRIKKLYKMGKYKEKNMLIVENVYLDNMRWKMSAGELASKSIK